MSRHRDIRRCALQVLYQFESGNIDAADVVRSSLDRAPGDESVHQAGLELAKQAWEARAVSDRAVGAIAPKWPVHRQPVVDRSILRLAHYEMFSGRTPPKVVINEAVELAKEFSTEKSPSFVNGVLDKLYREMREGDPGAVGRPDEPAAVHHHPEPTGETEH